MKWVSKVWPDAWLRTEVSLTLRKALVARVREMCWAFKVNFVFILSLRQGHQPVQKETYHPCLDTTVENLVSFRLSDCILYCVHSLLCHARRIP